MGRKKTKKDVVTTDKNAASMIIGEENASSNDQEMAISQKLDILIDMWWLIWVIKLKKKKYGYRNKKKEVVGDLLQYHQLRVLLKLRSYQLYRPSKKMPAFKLKLRGVCRNIRTSLEQNSQVGSLQVNLLVIE